MPPAIVQDRPPRLGEGTIEAYLRRLDLSCPPEPSPAGLAVLHRQHMRALPLENLDNFLGESIGLAPAALFDKLLRRGRGGLCYELNQGFALLLEDLGFELRRLEGQVFSGQTFGPAFDHLLLLVRFPEGDFIADVGFGNSFELPLPLREAEHREGETCYRLGRVDEGWLLSRRGPGGRWQSLYRFGLRSHEIGDYAAMCVHHQSSPASHFTQRLICSRATREGRVTLGGLRLIETRGHRRIEHALRDVGALQEALQTHFGFRLGQAQLERLMEKLHRPPA